MSGSMLDRRETEVAPKPVEGGEGHYVQDDLGLGCLSVAFGGLVIGLALWVMYSSGCTPPDLDGNGAANQAAVDSATRAGASSAPTSTVASSATDVAKPADWQPTKGGQLIEPPVTDGSQAMIAPFKCAPDEFEKFKANMPSLVMRVGSCITDYGMGDVRKPICYIQVWVNGPTLEQTLVMMRQAEDLLDDYDVPIKIVNAFGSPFMPQGWLVQVRFKADPVDRRPSIDVSYSYQPAVFYGPSDSELKRMQTAYSQWNILFDNCSRALERSRQPESAPAPAFCFFQVWVNGPTLKETEQMMLQAEVAFATFEPALQVDNAYKAPLPKGWTVNVRSKGWGRVPIQ